MKELDEKFSALGVSLVLPPPSVTTLGTHYIEMDLGKMLAAEFKYDVRFTNPLRTIQGGFLCAAFDDVYGPLTYMAAMAPVMTIEMSTTFIRPFTAETELIRIKAVVVSKSKSLLVLKAEAHSKDGKLIAISTNHSMIVSQPKQG
jgi:uncharacterized protein (TIGR00369 family)